MRLSIITINLNEKEGITNTIKSVISQSFKDYEYIVIDGQSTDGSVDIIKSYSNVINYWVSEKDLGIYNAMNKGIKAAKGEYCLFLNSGDVLYNSTALESLFSIDFNEEIISCGLQTYSNTDQHIQLPPEHISLFTFTNGSLAHPSTLIKRSVFERVGAYIEHYKIISDWCFFIDALIINHCTYKKTDLILSSFNCYGLSSTSSKKEEELAQSFLQNRFSRIIDDYKIFEEESIFNTLYWMHKQKKVYRMLFLFPFKVFNRILHLRNKLKIRISTKKINTK